MLTLLLSSLSNQDTNQHQDQHEIENNYDNEYNSLQQKRNLNNLNHNSQINEGRQQSIISEEIDLNKVDDVSLFLKLNI